MTKFIKRRMGGDVSASPREMARAKHILFHNKEEAARGRASRAENIKSSLILDVGGDRFLSSKKTLLR